MKKNLLFLFVIALAVVSCSKGKYKYETVKGDLTEARIYTLKNGLKVYLSGGSWGQALDPLPTICGNVLRYICKRE